MPYLVAFELLETTPLRERLRALLPAAAVLVPWAVLYRLGGFGARGSELYLDPVRDVGRWLSEAPERLLALAGCLGLNFPADLWILEVPGLRHALAALGVFTVAFFAWLVRAVRRELPEPERRLHDFFLLGAVLSMLPGLSTYPAARLLVLPSAGAAAVLALLARHLFRHGRGVLLAILATVYGPVAVFHWVGNLDFYRRVALLSSEAVKRIELERDVANLRVVVLTSGDGATLLYPPLMWALGGAAPVRSWWVLSNVRDAHRLTRTGRSTLELEPVRGRFVEGFFEKVLRSPRTRPLTMGDVVHLDGGAVTVLAVDDGYPTRIRLELDEPFEAPDVRLIEWRDGSFKRARLPAVGETVELPRSPGLLELAAAR